MKVHALATRGISFLLIFVCFFYARSQSGPGGVGTNTSNVIWLDASTLSLSDGADVSTWLDISGNSVSFGASADAGSNFPDFMTDGGAGFPALDFNDGNEERLIINPFGNMPSTAITTIMVFATANNSEGIISYSAVAGGGGNNEYLFFDASSIRTYVGDANNAGGGFNDGLTTYNIFGSTWESAGGALRHYKNGTTVNTATLATGDAMVNNGVLAIGGEQDSDDGGYDSGQDFGGRIAEIIMYNTSVTDAERLVIENYLSAKYGIAISTDLFSFASSTYANDVIGIGNNGTSSHMTSTGSGGGLILSGSTGTSTTTFDTNEWLFTGHDGGSTSPSLLDVPAGTLKRLTRIWAFDESAPTDGYDVTITFDLNEIGISGASNYTVFKRTGTTGNFTDLALTPTVLGSDVSFTLQNADIEDAYFTLGFEANASPGGFDTDLALWLQANTDVLVTGSSVTDWVDQSGNANNATDPSNLAEFQESIANFNPGIAFDSDATSLEGAVTTTNNDLTFFTVYQDNSAPNSGGVLFDFDGTNSHALSDNNYSGGSGFAANINKNSPTLISIDHPNGTTTADIYQNGSAFETNYSTLGNSVADTYSYTLGDADAGGSTFSGTINELIIYERTLLPAERQRVESFLAIKYGITLGHDYLRSDGTEIFDIDGATNDGYENQIVAIGSDSDSRLFQRVSKSVNDSLIIAVEEDYTSSNDSRGISLANNSFFFVSNDGGDFGFTTSGDNQRLNRVWKVNESGTVGSVFLGIRTSLFEFDSLLVSTDPTFNSGVTRVAVSTLGNYNSVSYDFTDGDYFTFTVDQKLSSDNEDLLLWLRADAGVTTSGSNVTVWSDQSSFGNDADDDDSEFDNEAQLATIDEDPVTLGSNDFNFNPSIAFGGADRPLTGSMTTSGGFNFFLVGIDTETGIGNAWFDTFQDNSGAAGENRSWFFEERYGSSNIFTTPTLDNARALYSIEHPEGTSVNIYENGGGFELGYSSDATNNNDAGLYHYVLGDDATGGQEFVGRIAEFIVFQGSITEQERQSIESYLAIKYGITLTSDYEDQFGNVLFDVSTIANDRFENNIVALGRNDVLSLNQKVSKSDSGNLVLALEQNFENSNASRSTSLSNDQYFFASSNLGSVASDSSYRGFTGNRLGRKWKINETNNPGSVYVAISDTVAASFNVLIVSNDSTFTSGVTEVPLNQSGGFYFVNHDFNSGDYFTFASSVSPGGVGGGLQLWLKADAGVVETSNNVSSWGDQSGNGNDGTTPATDPVIVDGAINFNPAIEFASSGTRVEGAITTNTDSLSFLMVVTDSSATSSNGVLFELDNSGSALTFDDGTYATVNFSSEILKDTAQLLTVVQPDAASSTNIYQNGTLFEGAINPTTATSSTSYAIGENIGGGNSFDGLVAEFIAYDSTLTTSDREMLESYLMVKYALPTSHDIVASDGSVILDATASAGYLNGMVGLGYDVRTQLDQKVAKSVYDSLYLATTNDFATANTSRTTAFNDLEYVLITNDGGNYTLTSDYKAESNVRLDRVWEIHELNNPGAIFLALPNSGVFTSLNTILVSSDPTFMSGVTERSLTVSGGFLTVNLDLTDGQYFTFTTADPESSIWYSYLSGNWSDPGNWTLDGAISPLYLNPSNEIPSEGDSVVINSGRTITSDINGLLVERVEITGVLDLAETGGHDFTYLLGSGNLRLSGSSGVDNYPSGIDTLFYDPGEGGTVEYYGSGLTLDTKRRYNNVIFNLTNPSDEIVQTADSIIALGNWTITQGVYQFGDNSTVGNKVGSVGGNVLVEANGGIDVGTTDSRHEFNLSGDFTNQGVVEFTNRTSPDYLNEATDGIVDVNFVSASQDQIVSLDGTTNFYRIEVNKGVDATYKVELSATDASNFALFGYANENHPGSAQLTANNNNVGLIYGTLEIGNNIQIDELSVNGNYNVSEGAAINVNGGSLTGNRWIVAYGNVTLSSGSIDLGIGTVLRNSGSWQVDGGTCNMAHFRTSALGFGNDGSWTQTGGIVNITGSGSQASYYPFSLTYSTCSFVMTGGELNIMAGNSAPQKGIFLNAAPENQTVTGGTVTVDMANTDADSVFITSTIPFYNLIVKQSVANANSSVIIVDGGNSGGSAPDGVTLGRNKLEVINDLTIDNTEGNGTTFISDHSQVDITGSLTIDNGVTFSLDSAALTFEGLGSSQIDIQNGATLVLDTLIINKDISTTTVDLVRGVQTALQVDSLFSHQSGVFNYDTLDVSIGKNLIVNDTLGVSTTTGSIQGSIQMNGSVAQAITTNGSGFIYDLVIDNANGVSLSGDLAIDTLDLNTGIFDIGTSRLTSQSSVQTTGTFGSTLMIQTGGNASDGGVEYYFDGTADPSQITYPLGSNSKYTPAQVDLINVGDDGYIQINPVDGELLTTELTGGNILDYYWRVRNRNFSALPDVSTLTFTADAADDPTGGPLTSFVPGGVEDGVDSDDTPTTDTDFNRFFENNGIAGLVIEFDGEFSTGNDQPFQLRTANYTAGVSTRFPDSSPTIYYTTIVANRQNWSNESVWTLVDDAIGADDGTTGVPGAGDIAVLKNYGNGSDDHWVTVNTDITVAQLIFDNALGGWSPRAIVNDRDANLDLGPVSGIGQFQLFVDAANTPAFIGTTDLGDFSSQTNSQFNFVIAADNQTAQMPSNITEYPQVRIEAGNGNNDDDNRILETSVPITINSFLQLDRSPRFRANHDVTVLGDVRVTWQLNRTTIEIGDDREVTFDIGGDLLMRDGAGDDAARFLVKNDNLNGYEHTVRVRGDIEFESGLAATSAFDLYNGASPNNNAILELSGVGDFSLTNNAPGVVTPDLYRVVMNAGTDTTSTFTFNDTFTLGGVNTSSPQSIELQNGKLVLNDPAINLELADNSDFSIPSTSGLEVTQGTVTSTGANIILDGLLRVNGGTATLASTDIEYSSTGNALLDVSSGTLNVGGQIRRSLTASNGVLKYRQTGGDVDIATDGAGNNSRAAFEILNAGSEFTLTGGTFNIERGVTGDANASLELSPATYDLTNSTINIFENLGSNYGSNFFNIVSSIPLNNLTIANTINLPDARLFNQDLVVNDLTINTNQTLISNGFNVTLNGNFVNDGTYTNTSTETIFAGSGAQSISGGGTYTIYDLRKNGSGTTTSNITLDIGHDLLLNAGTLDIGSNSINLENDAFIESTLTNSGGEGLVFNGNTNQELSGLTNNTIDIGTITISNVNGVDIPDGNGYDFNITQELRLNGGVFNIGGSLVTLEAGTPVTAVSPFNVGNMVQTNSSFTDNGLKIDFFTVAADTTIFFPIGELKYTPVQFDLVAGTTAGGLRVRPANERHPTIIDDAEPGTAADPEIDDTQNVLQYHWIVVAENLTNATGSATFFYNHDDITNIQTDTANFISARLLANDVTWDKFDPTFFRGASQTFDVPLSNVTSAEITGDYTAGAGSSDGINADIEGAIPDQLAQYETSFVGTGNYSSFGSWSTLNGPDVTDGVGPVGAQIIVRNGDDLLLDISNVRLYSTEIEAGGILRVPTGITGVRLGNVTGSGTIVLEDNELLPTGEYTDFLTCSGGGLQYSGSTSYSVLSGISQIRKVVLEGSGTRTLPNNALNVCDTLEINGPTVAFSSGLTYTIGDGDMDRLDIQSGAVSITNGSTIDVTGDLIVSGGSLTGVTGTSVQISDDLNYSGGTLDWNGTSVTLDGASEQLIDGAFTGSSAFDNLTINNSDATGVTINSGDIEVNGTLLLTDGLFNSTTSETITLTSTGDWSGASSASYITGPLRKNDVAGLSTYQFPVGKTSRYAPISVVNVTNGGDDWTAEYFTSTGGTYSSATFDNTDPGSGFNALTSVENTDRWQVESAGLNSAQVTAAYGAHNGFLGTNIRIVWWDDEATRDGDAVENRWENQGGLVTGDATSGIVTSENTIFFSIRQIGLGYAPDNPLPVELTGFNGVAIENNVYLDWSTSTELNNDHFEIERSLDGQTFEVIGQVAGNGTTNEPKQYKFVDQNPSLGDNFYRLRQVDFDGAFEYSGIIKVTNDFLRKGVEVTIYPNPASSQNLNLRILSGDDHTPISIKIIDLSGQIYYSDTIDASLNYDNRIMPDSHMIPGLYFLVLQQGDNLSKHKLVIR